MGNAESVIYHPDQMIVRFPVYRKAAGADASTYEKVGEGTAYVTPDLTAPKLRITLESPATGDYDYAIAATGLTGTGPMSDPITVRQYVESPREALENLANEYGYELRHYSYHYTLEAICRLIPPLRKRWIFWKTTPLLTTCSTPPLTTCKRGERPGAQPRRRDQRRYGRRI